MRPTVISREHAKRLIVAAQGLDGGWDLPRGKGGILAAVERLGYVQIDTISVVARAHHHTLWSRRSDYRPAILDELHARDRSVFEYWTHAASILPMAHYRYSLRRMRAIRDAPRTQSYLKANAALIDRVRRRIRDDGALSSADFEDTSGRRRGSWWDWKPAKRALETLYSTGELMIAARCSFKRVYDLAERVRPDGTDISEPDVPDQARFIAAQRLATRGLAAAREHPPRERPALERAWLDLVDSGRAIPVCVERDGDVVWYAATDALERVSTRRTRRRSLSILSPFDSLVIDRDRARRYFDFDYKLEAYTPRSKRRYGYFCLPLLWGADFVGRIDARADRPRRTLVVETVRLESGVSGEVGLLRPLARRLRDFAGWNGCDRVRIVRSVPRSVAPALRREVSEAR